MPRSLVDLALSAAKLTPDKSAGLNTLLTPVGDEHRSVLLNLHDRPKPTNVNECPRVKPGLFSEGFLRMTVAKFLLALLHPPTWYFLLSFVVSFSCLLLGGVCVIARGAMMGTSISEPQWKLYSADRRNNGNQSGTLRSRMTSSSGILLS